MAKLKISANLSLTSHALLWRRVPIQSGEVTDLFCCFFSRPSREGTSRANWPRVLGGVVSLFLFLKKRDLNSCGDLSPRQGLVDWRKMGTLNTAVSPGNDSAVKSEAVTVESAVLTRY